MKVVFDISVLGIANLVSYSRTGTFRYVENLAHGLAKSSECDLRFCALRPLGQINSSSFALDYLEDNSRLSHVPFIAPPLITPKRILDHQINRLNGAIECRRSESRLDQIHRRAIRRLFSNVRIMFEAIPDLQISKELEGADIFYFPSNSTMPKRTSRMKNLKRFITVYDLAPILYPDFFAHHEENLLRAMIASLGPEDRLICISHSTKDDLLSHFTHIDPSRVVVTHLAASDFFYPCSDTEKISNVKRKYGIAPHTPYVLSVGTLEPRKNLDHVIEGFSRFVRENHVNDLNLVLVGPKGWNYERIFVRVAQEEWLKDRVIFTGYVADEDLAPLYTGALAFVYLSFHEGFGLPPLEAMQCGTPVIVSNTSSFPEVVGEAGLMIDPRDRDAFGQALHSLYHSISLRETMSRKSLERARQFSWDKCTRETIAAFKMAVDN
jgi:glycosyltransferase involved in cell wall biosynthesis